ncbi:putative ATP-dependent RNA helicase DDX28 [Mixophyes fleayi]|uniref:putative ATP-dependent RNA helicase DDX28 n=1 Tax=Mixophyes fleayi TaxID=3061075 RepID=UPI003F4DED44
MRSLRRFVETHLPGHIHEEHVMLTVGEIMLQVRVPLFRIALAFSTSELPVIRLPRRTDLWLESRENQNGPILTPRGGKLLISTRRRELIQFSRDTCGQWEQPSLVSRGWKHSQSHGDYFTINRQQAQRRWPETDDTFHSLDLNPTVVSALDALKITSPTWMQKQTIPILLRGSNVLCASETGSGKTLVYLIPILQKLITQPGDSGSSDPRSLILVPSRELADQVTSVARRLTARMGLTVRFAGGGRGRKGIVKQFDKSKLDILVATPGALVKALKWNELRLDDLCFLALDEADTLFDDTFSELVEEILMQTRIASLASEVQGPEKKAQLAVIGATFPKGVGQLLSKMTDLGGIYTIKSKRLHFLMPHVRQTFKKLRGSDKISELVELLTKQAVEKHGSGVLVFCNTSKTVNWLGYILNDHDIKHSRLHGQMPADMRIGIFESFQKGHSNVLVCTDIASRGLDSCRVETVVNYDFPPTLQDYLHRAGRVGRVGSECQGSVVSFVTHAWDVELVQKIETAARKRCSLPGMESRIKEPIQTNDLLKDDQERV